ncbi:MAG: class I SAM-dependent methyltransferase [Chlorobi bacterium]|nr:class I SAM-dependent methyltransferase [Chlorobiota bacterium]MCI0717280.1 class I SAM-dependent methyltransferase [Chlorobiota bacterium]
MTLFKDIKIYFRMLFSYKPKKFWNELLTNSFDLRGVGHYRMSNEENLRMYEKKKKILTGEMLKSQVLVSHNTSIIEIGVGVGYWTEFFRSHGAKNYTGNDIAEISITKLQQKYPDYKFLHGDISEVTLPEKTFDLGVMIDVTQHITDEERFNKAMDNLWKSLKRGAFLIITIWDPAKNVYLSNKLRLNRIEKPRGLDSYLKIFGTDSKVLSNVDFNDKNLLIIRKP